MTAAGKTKPESDEKSPKSDDETKPADRAREIGGRKGPEPTRYGDWEKNGLISDF